MSTVDPLPRAEQRRVELLDRLARLFLAEGFLGFGVGDLAARLRCSRSSLYLVAASKPEIVLATLRDWFRGAAQRIEERVLAEPDPAARLRTYLLAVSDELAPASPQFYADLVAHPPAGEVYEENTRYAARRVRALVDAGVEAGALRPVDAVFVGAAVAEVMTGIQAGRVGAATGLSDAEAYRALADVVVGGLARTGQVTDLTRTGEAR
ncbi:AcrR family transcriptional regulator [Nocardioides marinisabuli]|uniref:AcrR family transcriptional regulator n=1 Tax=Nocardioides marinisabuli TaxID=419476 RepID=A0A7Y9F1X5_9ACTN|nr:TetR/AcrR family transcriptional regulator [Nocardioides marinisabuli]NYD57245.1 AcrR family transcriptional regulator [Nocardioides marinisabuli]